MMTAFLMAALSAAAIAGYTNSLLAFAGFLLPALLPYGQRLISLDGSPNPVIALFLVFWALLLWVMAKHLNSGFREQIALNLKNRGLAEQLRVVKNAVEHTGETGRVRVSMQSAETGWVEVTVADNGGGMAPEAIAAAQVPFGAIAEQGHLHRSADAKETGGATSPRLNLPLTKGLVEVQGGRFAIDSAFGVGTGVSLKLTVAAEPTETEPAGSEPNETLLQNLQHDNPKVRANSRSRPTREPAHPTIKRLSRAYRAPKSRGFRVLRSGHLQCPSFRSATPASAGASSGPHRSPGPPEARRR